MSTKAKVHFAAAAIAAVFWATSVPAAPQVPVFPGAIFSVVSAGAVGDGQTDNTNAIQKTIQAAAAAQGGTVKIPAAAQPYLCGPITIGSNILLQIEAGAVLQLLPYGAESNRPGTYPWRGGDYANFITITGNNVGISGTGAIEGAGAAWWAAFAANSAIPHRPHLIQFTNCNFVLVRDVTLLNSPMFHLSFGATSDVTIEGVTIRAPANSLNTDGIDPSGSRYLIQNCNIATGDDNICLKPQNTFCADITIRNCRFGSGLGLAIGGQTNSGVDGLTVSYCTFDGTENGLRLKADPTAGGLVQNVTYSNLLMTNVQYPIVFYSYYDLVGLPGSTTGSNRTTVTKVAAWNATAPSAAYRSYNTATMPTWRNITINNLTATRSGNAPDGFCILWGLPNRPVANVVLNNVITTGYAGFAFFNAANVQLAGTTRLAGTLLSYNAQVISAPPQNQVTPPGGPAVFSVATLPTILSAGAVAPTYRWSLNGQPLADGERPDGSSFSGATSSQLTVLKVQGAETGNYAVTITTAMDTYDGVFLPAGFSAIATTAAATLTARNIADVGRLVNVSVRSEVGRGAANLIAGITIGGRSPGASALRLLIRGMGPSLAPFGVTGYLADPILTLYNSSQAVAANDNWSGTAPIKSASAQVGAFAFASDDSRDAALIHDFEAGNHTVQIAGVEAQTGAAIAEAYDLTPAGTYDPAVSPRIINLSARGQIDVGSILFAGFRIGGSTAKTVLVRAIGPTLGAFGVPETLVDPKLDLFAEGGALLRSNDDWGLSAGAGSSSAAAATFALVGAFPLEATTKDAVIVTTLPPGGYTAQVTGVGDSRGVVLVEIYEVP